MEVHFIMRKITREQKIEIYRKRKLGQSAVSLSKEYAIRRSNINYLISIIDRHGEGILKDKKNKHYPAFLKNEMINKVLLEHQPTYSVAIEYGLSSPGMLVNWIKSYKENGYVIVEKTKERSTTMTKKNTKPYEDMTAEEKVKYLEDKTIYLETENAYLKKLRAVVQARKGQQPKKK